MYELLGMVGFEHSDSVENTQNPVSQTGRRQTNPIIIFLNRGTILVDVLLNQLL